MIKERLNIHIAIPFSHHKHYDAIRLEDITRTFQNIYNYSYHFFGLTEHHGQKTKISEETFLQWRPEK